MADPEIEAIRNARMKQMQQQYVSDAWEPFKNVLNKLIGAFLARSRESIKAAGKTRAAESDEELDAVPTFGSKRPCSPQHVEDFEA